MANGLYQCKGAYKSLDFNNGKVIVDLGFIKKQGTYEVSGHNVTLTLDGKNLVLESSDIEEYNTKRLHSGIGYHSPIEYEKLKAH